MSEPVRLWCVDDDLVRRDALVAAAPHGCDVIVRTAGDVVASPPDLLVAGGAAGAQAVEALQATAIGRRVPVLFVCGRGGEGAIPGFVVGRDDVLLAPFSAAEATARIGAACGRIRVTRELASTFDRLTDAFFAVDRDFRVTYINESALRLTASRGRPGDRREVIGKHIGEVIVPAEHSRFRDAYQEAMRTMRPIVFEDHYTPFDLWVEIHAYPDEDGLSVYVTDVSARKRVERELILERERLQTTLRSIGEGVVTTEADGRVRTMNPIAEILTGWSGDEAVGRPLGDVCVLVDERTRERLAMDDQRQGLLVAKDGVERVVATSSAPVATGDRVLGAVHVMRDMTRWRRIEEEVARAGKLESMGVLAGGIAHDFNNLLTAIVANLSLVQVRAAPDPFVADRLSAAMQACDRARALTARLLTFARGGAPIKQRVDVARILEDAARSALEGQAANLDLDVPEDLPEVEADPVQLAQVFSNVALNAAQAMPAGGVVRIRAELARDGYVRVAFEDEGSGIPADVLPRIFDPFFTTKPTGTGLGLTTAYSIVRRHGGTLHVTSANGGTVVAIELPAASEPASGGESRPRASDRVLLLDDEPAIREATARGLEAAGLRVDVVSDGAEAVAAFERAWATEPYGAVVCDLTIPGGMGGREAIARIRAIDPDVHAIAVSGYSEDPVLADPRRYGFDAMLRKPFAIAELLSLLG